MSAVHPLIEDNLRGLEEARTAAAQLDVVGWNECRVGGASFGAQYRHVLDHYLALLRGVTSGTVDYEGRERDPRIETDPAFALEKTDEITAALGGMAIDVPLQVRVRAGPTAELDLGERPSSVERELHFVLLHAIHHYAMMAEALRARGLAVPEGLGVAPATRGHRLRTAG